MIDPYINGEPVSFNGDTMVVQFVSRTRVMDAPCLRNVPGRQGYVYQFTYSPATGSALNGVAASQLTKDVVLFAISLLGGVKLASVYAEMKAKHAAMMSRRPRKTDNECRCGRCFDCVAQ